MRYLLTQQDGQKKCLAILRNNSGAGLKTKVKDEIVTYRLFSEDSTNATNIRCIVNGSRYAFGTIAETCLFFSQGLSDGNQNYYGYNFDGNNMTEIPIDVGILDGIYSQSKGMFFGWAHTFGWSGSTYGEKEVFFVWSEDGYNWTKQSDTGVNGNLRYFDIYNDEVYCFLKLNKVYVSSKTYYDYFYLCKFVTEEVNGVTTSYFKKIATDWENYGQRSADLLFQGYIYTSHTNSAGSTKEYKVSIEDFISSGFKNEAVQDFDYTSVGQTDALKYEILFNSHTYRLYKKCNDFYIVYKYLWGTSDYYNEYYLQIDSNFYALNLSDTQLKAIWYSPLDLSIRALYITSTKKYGFFETTIMQASVESIIAGSPSWTTVSSTALAGGYGCKPITVADNF